MYTHKEPKKQGEKVYLLLLQYITTLIIIMYIYHVLINALSAHLIHINLNMIFYTHIEHSPTKITHTF